MKQKTGVPRLLEIAGEKRGLLIISALLSTVSALSMLVPYASVYFILKELLEYASNPVLANGDVMIRWGVIALLGLLVSLVTMYAGGMASHLAAFRILYGLRVRLASHIGKLPLGWLSGTSTGAVKKTLEQNVEKVETFIAHQLPDLVHVLVTTILMIIVMFYLNIWLAVACMIPILIGFGAQLFLMTGPKMKDSIKLYYDSLERMNGSAVQYVRGMPAIKVFGQTVHSFRKFHVDMILYRDYCVNVTNQVEKGFLIFKVTLGSFAAFLLPVGVFLLSSQPESIAFASTLLFFLVMAPGISSSMFKIMYLTSTLREISEGVDRVDQILAEKPIPEPENPQKPRRFDIQFDNVCFSYPSSEKSTNSSSDIFTGDEILSQISFTAKQN